MATKEFDKKFTTLTEEALHIALEYTNYSKEIDCVYLYISLELGSQYLVFYKINNHISFKSKLNNFSLKEYDVSDENQRKLNSEGNAIAEEIKKCFIEDNREVPTYLKITYEPQKGNYNCKIGYDKLLDLDNMVGELTIHFRWFKEMGGELEPWQKV
ncbi:immunity protein YezG family protein [Capnocytophaga canimorsus]|uniref:immunity protein YezG family protein n=1 Tax=Capnocytophaga canimorsus TaxID=28188 RepID=UPI00384CC0B5